MPPHAACKAARRCPNSEFPNVAADARRQDAAPRRVVHGRVAAAPEIANVRLNSWPSSQILAAELNEITSVDKMDHRLEKFRQRLGQTETIDKQTLEELELCAEQLVRLYLSKPKPLRPSG